MQTIAPFEDLFHWRTQKQSQTESKFSQTLIFNWNKKPSSCIMSIHRQGKRIKVRKSLEIHHTRLQGREESSRRQKCFCLGTPGKLLCTGCSVELERNETPIYSTLLLQLTGEAEGGECALISLLFLPFFPVVEHQQTQDWWQHPKSDNLHSLTPT